MSNIAGSETLALPARGRPLSLLIAPAPSDVSRVRLLADFLTVEIRRLPGADRGKA
jgi:hypothetical protein